MLDRLAEWILAIPGSVPILLGADPHNAALVRAIAAVILIVIVIYVIAVPLPFIIRRLFGRRSKDGQN
jgi:hypothetical protein